MHIGRFNLHNTFFSRTEKFNATRAQLSYNLFNVETSMADSKYQMKESMVPGATFLPYCICWGTSQHTLWMGVSFEKSKIRCIRTVTADTPIGVYKSYGLLRLSVLLTT